MGTLGIIALCLLPSIASTGLAALLFFRELRIREKSHSEALLKIVAEKDARLSDAEGRLEQLQVDLAEEKRRAHLAERRLRKAEEPLQGRQKARTWAEIRRINDHENERQQALEEEKRGNTKLRAG